MKTGYGSGRAAAAAGCGNEPSEKVVDKDVKQRVAGPRVADRGSRDKIVEMGSTVASPSVPGQQRQIYSSSVLGRLRRSHTPPFNNRCRVARFGPARPPPQDATPHCSVATSPNQFPHTGLSPNSIAAADWQSKETTEMPTRSVPGRCQVAARLRTTDKSLVRARWQECFCGKYNKPRVCRQRVRITGDLHRHLVQAPPVPASPASLVVMS